MTESMASYTVEYLRGKSAMLMPSLMLVPGGCDRCIISLHFPDRFLGTAPSGLIMKSGSGGEGKGPAVWPAEHSAAR